MTTTLSSLHTPGFAHYAAAWSPFHPNYVAIASSANYGIVGNGRAHIVSLRPGQGPLPTLNLEKYYATQDALYDVAWSEIHENQLVTASGDGSIRLWDITLKDLPIKVWQEHTREVNSVDWSNLKKDTFVSASWDGSVKLWIPERPRSILTLQAHNACVYQASFSPHQPDLIASCSADATIKLFDLRSPSLLTNPTSLTNPLTTPSLTIPPVGPVEILSLDWNKYRPHVIAAASTDKKIRVWDCRMLKAVSTVSPEHPQIGGKCETELLGHEYAVREIQWSPHRADILASASYDMTCRVWNTSSAPMQMQLKYIHDAHTEFVVGCSWSLYNEGLLLSCGWDCRANLFQVNLL